MLLADCMAAFSAWSTFGTLLVALVALLVAWSQIRTTNSLRTTELIVKTYNAFVESHDMLEFYAQIRRGDPIDWEKDDRLLNKSLTLFDTLNYLQTQGLLHGRARAWEYIAGEIQCFASNGSACSYIEKHIQDGRDRGFPDDIVAFTGFPTLLAKIPERYRARGFPCIPEKHTVLRALVNKQLSSSQSLCARIGQQVSRIIGCSR